MTEYTADYRDCLDLSGAIAGAVESYDSDDLLEPIIPHLKPVIGELLALRRESELWNWLVVVRCIVEENHHEDQLWAVADYDGYIFGRGKTPLEAIEDAKTKTETPEPDVVTYPTGRNSST